MEMRNSYGFVGETLNLVSHGLGLSLSLLFIFLVTLDKSVSLSLSILTDELHMAVLTT